MGEKLKKKWSSLMNTGASTQDTRAPTKWCESHLPELNLTEHYHQDTKWGSIFTSLYVGFSFHSSPIYWQNICREPNYTDTSTQFPILASEMSQRAECCTLTSITVAFCIVPRYSQEDRDGWKKGRETWDGEWQPEFSHRLILTSNHLHPSLLLTLWWRQRRKGT